MRKLAAIFILSCAWGSTSIAAELFNPFEISASWSFFNPCEIKSRDQSVRIEHDCSDHDWINALIIQARKKRVYVAILVDNFIKEASSARTEYKPDPNHKSSSNTFSISTEPINFEYVTVKKKHISSSNRVGGNWGEYIDYVISNQSEWDKSVQHKIQITVGQSKLLAKILGKNDVEWVTLNLTALRYPKIYERFLSANEIIIAGSLGVN